MGNVIKIKGRIVFDPPDRTKKHKKQASWKKVAYVLFDGDVCEYYSWFIFKRYNLPLARPLRGPHVTFINDSERDIGKNISKWGDLKRKWDGKEVEVELDVDVRGDGINWWFKLTESSRDVLHGIRAEIGLGRPYWGLHMTLGYASDCYDVETENTGVMRAIRRNEDHSRYIHKIVSNENI